MNHPLFAFSLNLLLSQASEFAKKQAEIVKNLEYYAAPVEVTFIIRFQEGDSYPRPMESGNPHRFFHPHRTD